MSSTTNSIDDRGAGAGTFSPDELRAHLEEHGIAPTAQRLEVAAVLLDRPQHLSADQLLDRLRERGAAVSKATVYNTLALFARQGVVREVIVDPTRVVYDSNVSNHYHIYEAETGRLSDIDAASVAVGAPPTLPDGMTLDRVDVIFRVRRNSA